MINYGQQNLQMLTKEEMAKTQPGFMDKTDLLVAQFLGTELLYISYYNAQLHFFHLQSFI